MPIRRMLQKYAYDCGPTSVMIVFAALGIKASHKQLMKIGGTTKRGTSPIGMEKMLKSCGVQFETINNSNLKTLEKKISALNLCIVDYMADDIDEHGHHVKEGHYAVAFGFGEDYIWLADPDQYCEFGKHEFGLKQMSKDVFLEDWHDKGASGIDTKRWMIAVPFCQKKI